MSTSTTTEQVPSVARQKRNDVPVKLDAEVTRIARIVAAYEGMHLAEYLSERLRPLVVKDLERWQKKERPDGGAKE